MDEALKGVPQGLLRELKNLKEKFSHNTKENGQFRVFIYQEGDKYVGVCLNFDIFVEGPDIQLVHKQLLEACLLHIRAVKEENLSDDLLNR